MDATRNLLVLSAAAGIAVNSNLLAQNTAEEILLREALRAAMAVTNQVTPPVASQSVSAAKPAIAPTPRAVTLQDCLQQALEHNLDLRIERFNPQTSQYAVSAAQGDYDPVLGVSGSHTYSESAGTDIDPNTGGIIPGPTRESDRIGSGLAGLLPWGMDYALSGNVSETVRESGINSFPEASGSVGIGLVQPLLKNFWIDETRLQIRVAKIGLKISEAALQLKIMDVVTEVENAYYDLIAARETVKVHEKALELARRLFIENRRRVEVGSLAPLEEKQAEAQVATAQADLIFARQSLAVQQNALRSLLTDDYVNFHSVDLAPKESLAAPIQQFNLQDSWSKGMSRRPDLQQGKLNLEQAGVQLKYDYNQLFPQLNVVGSYGYGAGGVNTITFDDTFRNFRDRDLPSYSYGAVLTFPLGNRKARSNHKTSKVAVQQAVLAVKQIEQQILVEIDNAVTAAKASYERVDATHKASLYAAAALDAEQKKLDNGKSTSFNVLLLQRNLTDAQSQEISAYADYNKALAALARAEGSTLERRTIDLQLK